ncbi:MAG: Gfo/Idh/MocA family oxidoreductase [Planctomycetota bacterium]
MAPINVAFYGCGGIARYHLTNLKDVPDVRIVGAYDLSAPAIATFREDLAPADQAGFRAVARAEELFDLAPDAIYVCTPPFARGEFEPTAAARKIHLFLEKPIALSMEAAQRIAAAARENNIVVSGGYGLRNNAVYRQLRAALATRKISLALVTRWNKLIPNPWWQDRSKSGGQLIEMTTHQVDFLLWVLGDAIDVFGLEHTGLCGPQVSIPDAQAALVRFSSGAIASITTCCALKGQAGYNDMEFVCEDTRLILKGGELKADPPVALPEPETSPGIDALFIEAVRRKDAAPIQSTLESSLKTLELTLRIDGASRAANRRTEIGLMSACVTAATWDERFAAVRAQGVDFIELALTAEEAGAIAAGQGAGLLDELAGLAKKHALPIRSLIWPLYKDCDLAWAKDPKATVAGIQPALDLLRRSGGDVVLFPHYFSAARPGQEEAVVAALRAWAELAAPLGILLCVEQIPASKFQPSSEELAGLVRRVDRRNVKVYYDIANPIYRGEDCLQAARNLVPLTGQAHMKGYRQEKPLTLLPVREVRQMLLAAGFQGRVAIEDSPGETGETIKTDVAFLRAAGF